MLFKVPIGIGLLPCIATITWRPFRWRHFWWLPFWLTSAKPCLRKTRMTCWAVQTGKRSLTWAQLPRLLRRQANRPAPAQTKVQELPLRFGSLRPLCRLRRRNRVIRGKMPPNASFLNRVRQPAATSWAHSRSKRERAKASTSMMVFLSARPQALRNQTPPVRFVRQIPIPIETCSLPALARSYPRHFTLITRTSQCLRQLPWLRCRLPARSQIATCSMSLIPSAPLQAGHTANIFQEWLQGLGRGWLFPICGNRRECGRCNREKTWWCRRRQDRARLTSSSCFIRTW